MFATSVRAGLLIVVVVLGSALPAAAAHEPPPPWPEHRRIYFAATTNGSSYWTVDPNDPELSAARLVQRCGTAESWRVTDPQKPCFSGGIGEDRIYSTFFSPATLFEDPPAWGPSAPLRFHLDLDIEALAEYQVSVVLQQGTELRESSPATEISPGIFEGAFPTPPAPWEGSAVLFGIRVQTSSERLITDLRLRGASWLELPDPVGAKAVTDLIAADTHRPGPTSFVTDTRGFTFNDAQWESWSFQGELGETQSFELELPARAEAVVAWVEMWDSSFTQSAVREGSVDQRKVTDGGAVRLLGGGEEVAHSPGPYLGHGTAGLAALDVAAGPVTLEVSRLGFTDEPITFSAHAVAVFGDRTLASMRWRSLGDATFRLPVVASCPNPFEPFPVTDEVRSWRVDLDADTDAPGLPAWTISYELPGVGVFPCGEEAGGDWVRFTLPGEEVWHVAATPAKHGQFVSAFDTSFDWEVRYTYTAPPEEHEAV